MTAATVRTRRGARVRAMARVWQFLFGALCALVLVFLLLQRHYVRGLLLGGVKG